MKKQIKAPEKIQLRDKEIASHSDAQFKTLVIKMLTEMIEFGHKLDEKMKAENQDGSVGIHTVPPCTTKRRTTTI